MQWAASRGQGAVESRRWFFARRAPRGLNIGCRSLDPVSTASDTDRRARIEYCAAWLQLSIVSCGCVVMSAKSISISIGCVFVSTSFLLVFLIVAVVPYSSRRCLLLVRR